MAAQNLTNKNDNCNLFLLYLSVIRQCGRNMQEIYILSQWFQVSFQTILFL